MCEGAGQARVRGQVRRGGDRGGVPLGYFRKCGVAGPVSRTRAEILVCVLGLTGGWGLASVDLVVVDHDVVHMNVVP